MSIGNFDELSSELSTGLMADRASAALHGSQELVHGLDISGFFRIIRQQWLLIGMTTALSLLVALAYVMTATTRYTASTKILINPQPRKVFGKDYIPQDGNTNQILIESQTRIIASDAVLARVVDSENLVNDPEFSQAAGGGPVDWLKRLAGLQGAPEYVMPTPEKRREALRRLHDKLSVKRPSQTYVVEVSVNSRDADKAARLSRAVASAYISDEVENQASNTREMSELLQDRLAVLRARVREAELKVQAFRQKHNIVAAEGALVNERHLSRLNDELLAARNRMTQAAARADKVRQIVRSGVIPESFDAAVNSRLIASVREQYARSARREAQLATTLGSRHPQMIAARARLARSRKLINAELRRIAASLQADYAVEKKRVSALEKRIARARGVTDITNQARVELAALEREANARRAVFEQVLAKAREAGAEEKINLIDARIISPASPPQWASWPKKKIILPLALLLGLGLGLAGALVNDYRQDRFTSVVDLEQTIGLRSLGTVPNIVPRRFAALRALLGRRSAGAAEQGSYYRLYQELARVGSPYATAVMGVVRNLVKTKNAEQGQTVMLVSSQPHEGSSSIAWSAAISAALQKRKVLLVDGDGGKGDLSVTLAPENGGALRDVLSGKADLADLVVEDKALGLSFLPLVSGDRKHQAINWGEYQTMLARLPEIARNYDLVLVDGGAILNSGLAHMLVDVVDQVALVVRTGETSRKTVLEALRALDVPARKMAGVIVSAVDSEQI